jgi:hypothetical protein
MPQDFYSVQIPETRACLGFRLLPLRLGHLILLKRIGNAFLTEGQPDLEDLATAVLVCSRSYEEGIQILTSPDLDGLMKEWASRIIGSHKWSVRFGFKKLRPLDFTSRCADIIAYLNEHCSGPNYEFEPDKFSSLNCAPEASMKVFLKSEYGLSESDALNFPWRLCLWEHSIHRAMKGQISLVDKEKEDGIKAAIEIGERLSALFNPGGNGRG